MIAAITQKRSGATRQFAVTSTAIFILSNWCTNNKGQLLEPGIAHLIMKEKVFGGAPGPTTIVMKLRDTNSQIAKFAALLLKGHEDDFGREAHARAVAYANEKSKPRPLLLMPK